MYSSMELRDFSTTASARRQASSPYRPALRRSEMSSTADLGSVGVDGSADISFVERVREGRLIGFFTNDSCIASARVGEGFVKESCDLYCTVWLLGYEPCRVRRVVWGVEGRPSSPMGDSVRCRRARTHVGRPSPQSGRAVEANMIWADIDRPIPHESTYRLEHEHRYETQTL